MVSARIGVATAAAQSTNGATRDFVPWSGFGTVRGGMFLGSNAVTLGTSRVQAKMSVGFFDADLNQACVCTKSRDNVNPTSCHHSGADDRVAQHINNTGLSLVGEASISSLITDGVRATYDDGYPAGNLSQHIAVCVGGDDVQCLAGAQLINPALNGTEDIACDFVPTGIIAAANGTALTSSSMRPTAPVPVGNSQMFLGMAADHGSSTIVQGSWNWRDEGLIATATKEVYGLPSDTYLLAPITSMGGSASTDGAFKVTAFGDNGDGTGYVRIQKLVDNVDHWIAFLIIGGVPCRVKRQGAATSTGTQVVSSVGVAPRGLVQISCRSTGTIDSITGPGNAQSSVGIGAFGPSSGQEASVAIASENDVATSNCNSEAKAVGLYTPNHDVSDYMDAAVNDGTGSWGSDGWTTNWSNVLAGANHIWYLAIEQDAPACIVADRRSSLIRGSMGADLAIEAVGLRGMVSNSILGASAGLSFTEDQLRNGLCVGGASSSIAARALDWRLASASLGAAIGVSAVDARRMIGRYAAGTTVGLYLVDRSSRFGRTSLLAIVDGGEGELMTIVFDVRTSATLELEIVDVGECVMDLRADATADLSIKDSAEAQLEIRTEAGAELN